MAAIDIEYAGIKSTYRRRVQNALANIRDGGIQEQDLDKLHNFCMVALMLMTKVNRATWRSAERMAELADLLQEGQIVKAENSDECEHQHTNQTADGCPDAGTDDSGTGDQTLLAHTGSMEQIQNFGGSPDSREGAQRITGDCYIAPKYETFRQGQTIVCRNRFPSS